LLSGSSTPVIARTPNRAARRWGKPSLSALAERFFSSGAMAPRDRVAIIQGQRSFLSNLSFFKANHSVFARIRHSNGAGSKLKIAHKSPLNEVGRICRATRSRLFSDADRVAGKKMLLWRYHR
jgi:hypothetical protein